jgi:hypothetical protein
MSISSRFTEYGLTGAFLFITQVVLYFLGYGESSSQNLQQLASMLTTISSAFPPAFQPALMSLAATLALVSIFFIGLCLDLLGSTFALWEVNQFKKKLEKNADWLKPLVDSNKSYVGEDYDKLISEFGSLFSKDEWKIGFKILIFWKEKNRRDYVNELKRTLKRYQLLSAYNRFQSFLVSFVFVYSGSSKLELFVDQVHLWRTSRSISTVLIIVALETLFLKGFSPNFLVYLWAQVAYVLLVVISGFITLRSYGRMCSTLFSLVYVIANQNKTFLIKT